MELTERQKEILNCIIGEYVASAKPVSSQRLENKHRFKICPATIRNEMQKLTDEGFIFQPHTSAGRVPTDKGYRLFVDSLLEKEFSDGEFNPEIEKWFDQEFEDAVKFVCSLTQNLAALSSNLALGYLPEEKILWKEGWEKVLREPEFKEAKLVSNLAEMIKNFEKEIEEIEFPSEIQIYIGRENPFPKAREFSTILARCHFPEKEDGFLAIIGPKRMAYDRNINSLNYLMKLMEKF